MRTTLSEVAAAAELSVSTASRALNDHPAINASTKARVRQIAEQMRYKRVQSHRTPSFIDHLAGRNVAIITLGIDRSLVAVPAVTESLAGVEQALSEAWATVQMAPIGTRIIVPKRWSRLR